MDRLTYLLVSFLSEEIHRSLFAVSHTLSFDENYSYILIDHFQNLVSNVRLYLLCIIAIGYAY